MTRKNAIVAAFCLVALASFPSTATDSRPHLVCHKGECGDAPENTMPAFQLAIDRGLPAFECDIRVSKDGGLFCFHDNDMTRFGGSKDKSIENSTTSELLQYDAGAYRGEQWKGTKMPQLKDVLSLARDGLVIWVELKMDAKGVPLVKEELLRHPNARPGRIMFTTGFLDTIAAVKRDLPQYKVYYIHGTHWGKEEHCVWPTTWEILQKLKKSGVKPDGIALAGQPIMDRGYWGDFKRAGMEVDIWTIDDPKEVKRYLDEGVDWVTTNYGKRAYDYIRGSGVRITDVGRWTPMTCGTEIEKGSALDFSGLRGTDGPSGSHGRVIVKGDHFVFEDSPDVPRRFYGVNLCGTTNLPTPEDGARMAETFARLGYNAVRFHHHDDGLVMDNDGRTELNPESMNRLDALIAACIANGIYITTDLFVSRRVPYKAIGINRDGFADGAEIKELILLYPPATSNFLAFAENFLTHVNPYTGRSLSEEPALMGLSLVNEGGLGGWQTTWAWKNPGIQETFKKWLAAKKRANPAAYAARYDVPPPDLSDRNDPQVLVYWEFLHEAEVKFYTETKKFLREKLKCRAPLTNMNSGFFTVGNQTIRAANYDYIDDHCYIDHPQWRHKGFELPTYCDNQNIFKLAKGKDCGPENAFLRVYGKPRVMSEINYATPATRRGVGGLYIGAVAAAQNWDGVYRFAWSHDLEAALHPDWTRLDYLNIVTDPLMVASEHAVVSLFLGGDLAPMKEKLALLIPPSKTDKNKAVLDLRDCLKDWTQLAFDAQVGTCVGEKLPGGCRSVGNYPEVLSASVWDVKKALSGAKSVSGITVDRAKGLFCVNTPRTCGVFSECGETIRAGALTVLPDVTPTTAWVSSLDSRPIAASKRMLVTVLTDVQMTDAEYADATWKELTSWGHLPRMMKVAETGISIAVDGGSYEVYALLPSGRRRCKIASKRSDGRLLFTANVAEFANDATYLYEIVRKD